MFHSYLKQYHNKPAVVKMMEHISPLPGKGMISGLKITNTLNSYFLADGLDTDKLLKRRRMPQCRRMDLAITMN
jgi:hypothetical protein